MARTDIDLPAAAREGDRDALGHRHQDAVFRFGTRLCGDPEDGAALALVSSCRWI